MHRAAAKQGMQMLDRGGMRAEKAQNLGRSELSAVLKCAGPMPRATQGSKTLLVLVKSFSQKPRVELAFGDVCPYGAT